MWPAAAAARGPWGARTGLGALWRGLHLSPASSGKNLLKKFAARTRKKFWYEGPTLGSHLTHKPSRLEFLTKSSSVKTKKEDHIRQRALSGLLYKALTDLLCTPEVSQEVCDLNVELSKVSLTSDFSACRVYWKTTLSAEHNAHAQAVLQRSATQIRHLLLSLQILRNIPPIVFVQDKGNAALAEVDKLLATADFGPPEEKEDFVQNSSRYCSSTWAIGSTMMSVADCWKDQQERENHRQRIRRYGRHNEIPSQCALQAPPASSSLFGIDHEAFNKQIMEYKRRKEKGQGHGSGDLPGPPYTAQQTGQMHKRKKKARSRLDMDLSPRALLWETATEHHLNSGGPPEDDILEHEWEGPEAELEVGREDGQKGGSD